MTDIIKGLLVILFLLIIVLVPNIKLVQVNKAFIVERLGKFLKIIDQPGIYVLIPLLDRVIQIVSLEVSEKTFTFSNNDNDKSTKITIKYQVVNVKLFVYAALDSINSIKEYIKANISPINQMTTEQKGLIIDYAKEFGLEIIEIWYK